MLRKLLSHAAIYGLAAQGPRLAGVLALPVVTRYLTPADYGVAGIITAYAAVFAMLQSLGLSVVLVNSYARQPQRYTWIWRQLNGFVTLWSLVYGLLVLLALYFLVPAEGAAHRLEITLLNGLPIILFAMTDMQCNLYYQLKQKPLPVAIRSFIVGVLGVGLNVYTIAYLRLGYMGWFYAAFISAAVGFILNSYSIYIQQQLWPIFNFKWHRIKHSLGVSLPVVPHNLANFMLDTSDRLVLDVLRVPVQKIGLYNVAASFGTYFLITSMAISQAASPFYLKYLAQQQDKAAALQVRRLTFALQVLFLLATSLGCLWMREIFILLIKNEALQQAYPLAIIILMGYNFRPMYSVVYNTLTYREHTNKLWRISVAAGAGNVLLNFILVPIFGYQAAAYTTFAALMYMGYAGFYMKAFKASTQVSYYPVLWLSLTVSMLFIVYNIAAVAIMVKVILTAVAGTLGIVAAIVYQRRLQVQDSKENIS
ncbi:lipopolysaccharide biosynthesis protein [Pontibacter sp. KCTC 32443]|uniref:lipopolysaccharide biosynthesis protein n=1 Tax=Pontibacter TaxID=323449 RepID=UPI00164E02F5|nr:MULTISPECIES: lipopolysaccharide biosynthesis protein [Pontibacter]MBC5773964.1 lipopolysaccharide biosynthesis protein [Pontibacter sp. KCTC 32443]